MWHRGEGAVAWCLWTPSSRAAARKRVLGRFREVFSKTNHGISLFSAPEPSPSYSPAVSPAQKKLTVPFWRYRPATARCFWCLFSKKCCARSARAGSADNTCPSTPPAVARTIVSDVARPSKSTTHSKRRQAAALAAQSVRERRRTYLWPAVTSPRHATPPAPEAAAPHTAADGHIPSIKAARTCGLCTTRGATAVSPACRSNPLTRPRG